MKSEGIILEDEQKIQEYFEQSKHNLIDGHYEIDIDEVFGTDLKHFKISSIPDDLEIMIVDEIGSFFILYDGFKKISRCWTINADGWSKDYSATFYCKQIVEYVKNNVEEYKIQYESYYPDGYLHDIWYDIIDLLDYTVEQIIKYCKEIEEEISEIVYLQLTEKGMDAEYLENEKKFSLGLLMPLFRSMKFDEIIYNHGKREFGKDIIFTTKNKLGITRNYGIQVKTGDLSGEANSVIDAIISQIDDAFSIPYIDKYMKEEKYITDLIIIISGRYTNNAVEKILYKVNNSNVHFYDIDKVNELISKYVK